MITDYIHTQATKDAHNKLTVKLTDFGMSRFNKPEGNRGQMNFGPLKWMAPGMLLISNAHDHT